MSALLAHRSRALLIAAFMIPACSGSEEAGRDAVRIDSSVDVSPADGPAADRPGTDASFTADLPPSDLTSGDLSQHDLSLLQDQALPADRGPAADLAPAGPDPGPVQCRGDADCGAAGLSCTLTAPGGICSGCGSTCPDLLLCLFGSCVRECQGDGDCNVGMYCSATNRCLIRSCDTTTPCPDPYSCGLDGKCRRPACDAGGSCPPPLSCGPSTVCLEPL